MKTRLLCLVSIVLLTTSCFLNNDDYENYDDSQDELPAITQTGANTFGALVNGKVVIPKDGYQGFGGSSNPLSIQKSSTVKPIRITSKNRKSKKRIVLSFFDAKENDITTYSIGEGENNGGGVIDITRTNGVFFGDNKTYLSIKDSGSIVITRYDSEILSGTFSFKAVNKDNPEDIIEVTEGRFDINLETVNIRENN